ncbi:dihydrofolate reductase family protein [Kitasatospora atroaurantiaca]|uniref:Dihydrofolate reductase n=1 Tax=Kitasatospora atroaurantiaca TaxID=285545 RepID=A0A561F0R0_9ACTN|nr:dihydrofolate reductase family protein [Kitasatospora atroaurantiaca]TWE21453.1 dihydrofolate reductase [Kitasatospora atroaurantiaca]
MRKILLFMVASADGFYEGPHQEFDWPVVDDEFNDFALEQLDSVDTLLFGRVTYEGMAAYWPTAEAQQNDPKVAGVMNSIPKVVVSRTLERAEWANTRVIGGNLAEEIAALKAQPGKDIAVFGSSALSVSLLELGLLDEVRIMVNPVVLGGGKSLFRTTGGRIHLELLGTRAFGSGNVLLSYRPAAR